MFLFRYIYIINNYIISWNTTSQKTTILSSYKAEYIAIKEVVKEAIYLYNIL